LPTAALRDCLFPLTPKDIGAKPLPRSSKSRSPAQPRLLVFKMCIIISRMDPLTTTTTALTVAKTAAEISTKLEAFIKTLKDRQTKQQVEAIWDNVQDLKRLASKLEDENRDLRERLRFKTDDFEFRAPFYYDKARNTEQPLCPKCFASGKAGPMGEPGQGCNPNYRRCLVCDASVQIAPSTSSFFATGKPSRFNDLG
jgi:hypothetical protein